MPQILLKARQKEPHSLTREELYQELWITPTTKVAKAFGISDVAIAKICKRYAIPKPPPGYWAKVQNGKFPPLVPLPVAPHDLPVRILIGKDRFHRPQSGAAMRLRVEQRALQAPADIPLTHPLIKKTYSALMTLKVL